MLWLCQSTCPPFLLILETCTNFEGMVVCTDQFVKMLVRLWWGVLGSFLGLILVGLVDSFSLCFLGGGGGGGSGVRKLMLFLFLSFSFFSVINYSLTSVKLTKSYLGHKKWFLTHPIISVINSSLTTTTKSTTENNDEWINRKSLYSNQDVVM